VRRALTAHSGTMEASEHAFHAELEKGYNELLVKMSAYLF
jgi:hypothetical protein